MDRKTIFVVVFCLIGLVVWNLLVNKLYPPQPAKPVTTNVVGTTQSTLPTNGSGTATLTPATAAAAPSSAPRFIIDTNVTEELMVISNENARYTFTSHGGGLKRVELTGASTPPERESGRIPTLNANAPAPAFAVVDGEAVQGNGIFHLTRTVNGVRAEKQLPNGLNVVKNFVLGTNYLLTATVRLENQSDEALALPEQKWIVGTATPMNVQDDGQTTVGFMWFNGDKSKDTIGGSFFSTSSFCMPRTPPDQYSAGENNVVWLAVHNQFFALAAIPQQPAAKVVARQISLPPPTAEEIEANPRVVRSPKGYEAALVYPPLILPPQQALERVFQVYAGPKEYRTLARIGNNLDDVMSFGWFGFFSKALLLSMNWLHHTLSLSYGWAIIVITIIIKILFWPLTQASTRSMKRMQALQPQMKAVQEKYKDDPLKGQRKMMEFMKENKVNPMGGCLPMLLQMPVFIGFFYMIRSAIELRGVSFLWVADLSRPDTLFFIPGIGFPFNLLPLLMGATMLWQSHLTPPSPGMDPMQQKLLRYMPLMFMVFLYNFSAGLTLYWTVQNLLTIAQTKLTKAIPGPVVPVHAPSPALTRAPKKKK